MTRLFVLVCLCACLVSESLVAQSTLGPTPKVPPASRSADDILPPAPPIPDPPADPTPSSNGMLPTGPAPLEIQAPVKAANDNDPRQTVPRDRTTDPNNLKRASEEFANKHYAQAAALFTEADRHKESFNSAQRDEWAYCRLYVVAAQLNRGSDSAASLAQLEREVQEAQQMGPERIRPFAKQLLDEMHKRNPSLSSPPTAGWQCIESSSFRVMYQSGRDRASEVSRVAEAARVAMYERWLGPAGGNWSPRCDIYLHSSGSEYAKATGKSAEQRGHSTVQIRGGRVASRRIDLRVDDPTILESTLPSEVTQVLLTDAFSEEPLPRWAVVGMAALSESPASVARYQPSNSEPAQRSKALRRWAVCCSQGVS